MDSAILHLFAVDEVLERIGQNRLTGSFHIFTPKDSANIFFKDGLVVAAINGLFEGEDVLRKVLDWKGSRYIWQANLTTTTAPQKPLKLNIGEFLAKVRPAPVEKSGGESPGLVRKAKPAAIAVTTVMSMDSPRQPSSTTKQGMSLPEEARETDAPQSDMEATTNILTRSEDHDLHDSALLAKYKLVLVSVDSPSQRLRITQASTMIGRAPACDITIAHASISREHCLLQITDRGLHVKDLATTNGTKVNGIVLNEGYINVGDKLTVGHLVFVLEKE